MKKLFFLFALFTSMGLLSTNHIGQMPMDQRDLPIDATTRAATVEGILKELNDSYIFPEVAKKIETEIRQKLQNKEYNSITSSQEFAINLTADLRAISRDKHMRVQYSYDVIPIAQNTSGPTKQQLEMQQLVMRQRNFGFEKVENLPGGIGYINLRAFADHRSGAETVAAAMNFIANTDALIFDLRQNGGGNPAMMALICSYFFGDKPVHLSDIVDRQGKPTIENWTAPTVLGKKYGDKDVYILTSSITFSAGEGFSYNLQALKRATIVGETTRGGANPGGVSRINDHFGVFVPTGRAVNPITKTNWEGTGVEPDIKVPKELALKTAYLTALTKSAGKATNEQRKQELKDLADQTRKEIVEMNQKAKNS